MEIFLIGVGLYLVVSLFDTANKKPGCLYLLVFPLAIITLPFRLAAGMMGGSRRGRNGRKGHRF
jgi:hypothetical protein